MAIIYWFIIVIPLVLLSGIGVIPSDFAGGNGLVFFPVAWLLAEATEAWG
jgi:hypothetical protein